MKRKPTLGKNQEVMIVKVNDLIEKQKSESKNEPTANEKMNALFGKSIAKIMKTTTLMNQVVQEQPMKQQGARPSLTNGNSIDSTGDN